MPALKAEKGWHWYGLDLAVAVGILVASGQVKPVKPLLPNYAFFGGLDLDGKIGEFDDFGYQVAKMFYNETDAKHFVTSKFYAFLASPYTLIGSYACENLQEVIYLLENTIKPAYFLVYNSLRYKIYEAEVNELKRGKTM